MEPKKKPKKVELDVYEYRILGIMRRYFEVMNINQIAEDSGIHWKTTRIHLKKLLKKGVISIKKKKGRNCWIAKRIDLNITFKKPKKNKIKK